MTWLVERLAELARYIEHLRALRERVTGAEAFRRDLSLHNDVLFSLLAICQIVIDVSGELSARKGFVSKTIRRRFATSRRSTSSPRIRFASSACFRDSATCSFTNT